MPQLFSKSQIALAAAAALGSAAFIAAPLATAAGKTPGKQDLDAVAAADDLARPLVGLGGGVGEMVQAAMDVGVVVPVEAFERVEHDLRLEAPGQIARLAIDPRNPDIVYVAAQGALYGPNKERGIYKSTDGGKTFEKILMKQILHQILQDYDFILLDCAPGYNLMTRSALATSDFYILPARPEPLSVVGIQLLERRIAKLKENYESDSSLNITMLGIVLNM